MNEPFTTSFPVLPLRDIVVFPHMIVPLFVGREKSVRALEEVMQDDKQILLSSQIDPAVDEPTSDGIFEVGVLANVLQLLKLPDGTVKVLVEGRSRVQIVEYLPNDEFFEARGVELHEIPASADDYLDQRQKILRDITKADLDALAREYVDVDRMTMLVVGDKELVGKSLEELGYGKVTELGPGAIIGELTKQFQGARPGWLQSRDAPVL